jgi:hypothetical protein
MTDALWGNAPAIEYKRLIGHRVEYLSRMEVPMRELQRSFDTTTHLDQCRQQMMVDVQLNLVAFDPDQQEFLYKVPVDWRDYIKWGLVERFPWMRRFVEPSHRFLKHKYTVYEKLCPHLGASPSEGRCIEWASHGLDDYEVRYTWDEWLALCGQEATQRALETEKRDRQHRLSLTNAQRAHEDARKS